MTMTADPIVIDATGVGPARPDNEAPPTRRSERKGPQGRKSNVERIERERAEAAAKRKLEQEGKRAQPFDPLTRVWLGVALTIAVIIFATSALFSFATVADVAEKWMYPAWAWLSWVVPGFLEAFIIWFGLDAIMNQARGRKRDARAALVWMMVFASVAVAANAAHTIDGWGGDLSFWGSWIGTAMSALAPLSVVLITKRVSKLVFADPESDQS